MRSEGQRTISLQEGIGEQVGRLSIGDTQGKKTSYVPQRNSSLPPTLDLTRYPNQGLFVVAVSSSVYLVPHVEEVDYVFLKTIIPSRKATREYGMKGKL